ncbi:glucose-1-phosphate thymidylyltransferase [Hylemonella gracilis str. Niagara R]|uniref:Glucose-1-phosphate thymidylyltransferase n=1 Tax=Hylemonella gracilis str. Niagara R TaxID=1458275 RepID=A0A016XJA6_9BURK|nr:DUF4389 domain-containing protein [Hylemonella gracilis]EYC51308.1 glucose-1-phosphate thymidylyltransferase [Hylemonella gracilis str. Niagara R]
MSEPNTPPSPDNATPPAGPSKKRQLGLRAIVMVLMGMAFYLAATVLFALALVQLLLSIASDAPNERLRHFGRALGHYLRQIAHYLSFARDEAPFPFSDWPDAD